MTATHLSMPALDVGPTGLSVDAPGGPRRTRAANVLVLTQHDLERHPSARRNVLELARRGCDVDVICTGGLASPPPAEWPGQVRCHPVPIKHRRRGFRYPLEYGTFFLAALGWSTALGLRHRYAAVQADNLPDILAFAAPVPRLRGARLTLNLFELTPEMISAGVRGRLGRLARRVAEWVEAAAIHCADTVIVVSEPCREALRRRGVPDAKMVTLVNTTSALPPPIEARPGSGDRTDLVTHGTLVERYGTQLAVQAMADLRAGWPDLRLQVIGDGEQLPELIRLAHRLGVADRVAFTGSRPWLETLALVASARLGIVAVLPDGYGELLLPTKLLEYARLGVPAVCPRLPAIEAYFPPDSVAYFAAGDPTALSASVERLLREPDRARRQAERALDVVRGLAWERVRERYTAALGLPGRLPGQLAAAPGEAEAN